MWFTICVPISLDLSCMHSGYLFEIQVVSTTFGSSSLALQNKNFSTIGIPSYLLQIYNTSLHCNLHSDMFSLFSPKYKDVKPKIKQLRNYSLFISVTFFFYDRIRSYALSVFSFDYCECESQLIQ